MFLLYSDWNMFTYQISLNPTWTKDMRHHCCGRFQQVVRCYPLVYRTNVKSHAPLKTVGVRECNYHIYNAIPLQSKASNFQRWGDDPNWPLSSHVWWHWRSVEAGNRSNRSNRSRRTILWSPMLTSIRWLLLYPLSTRAALRLTWNTAARHWSLECGSCCLVFYVFFFVALNMLLAFLENDVGKSNPQPSHERLKIPPSHTGIRYTQLNPQLALVWGIGFTMLYHIIPTARYD